MSLGGMLSSQTTNFLLTSTCDRQVYSWGFIHTRNLERLMIFLSAETYNVNLEVPVLKELTT